MGKKKKELNLNDFLDFIKVQGGININQVVNVDCNDSKEKTKKKKKCECSGFAIEEFFKASICPDCTKKGSFVTFSFGTSTFSSITVSKPECFEENDVNYLSTSGKGKVITPGSPDVTGSFALLMADPQSQSNDAFIFSFLAIDPSGALYLIFYIGTEGEVKVVKCPESDCSCKNHDTVPAQLTTLKNSVGASDKKLYAKRIIIHLDGRVEEEDLSNLLNRSS